MVGSAPLAVDSQSQGSTELAVPVAAPAAATNMLQKAVAISTPMTPKGKNPGSSVFSSVVLGSSASVDLDIADSASQWDGTQDEPDGDGAPKSSKQMLNWLKAKLPLKSFMSGERLGRQERNVKPYLTNGRLNASDVKLLRNHLKLAIGWAQNLWHSCCR
jgi:hypothetical protein